MDLAISIGKLIFGFLILILGGEYLVRSAVSLAVRTALSTAIIGLTVVAAGTSAPELITSLLAAIEGAPDIAIGNIVGSNIFNILVIVGVASLIKPNKVGGTTLQLEWPFLMVTSIVAVVLGLDQKFNRWEATLFLVLLYGFIGFLVWQAKTGRRNEEPDEEIQALKNVYFDILYLAIGVTCLVGGAQLALDGGIHLGRIMGLTERVIGITIISVGTGLPELATSVVAAYRGRNDIAVANVIGSNIMNTLGIIGHTALIMPMSVSKKIITFDFWWMLGATAILYPVIRFGGVTITRPQGMALILIYISYIGVLLFYR